MPRISKLTEVPPTYALPKLCPEDSRDWKEWLRATAPPPASDGTPLRVVDLFSGCGGLTLGAKIAAQDLGRPLETVLAWDSDTSALDIYRDNFHPQWALGIPIENVFRKRKPKRRHQAALKAVCPSIFDEPIDVLLAGPPCQGNSDLNNHTRRKDDRNELYEAVGRFAEYVRPAVVLIENVPPVVHATGKNVQSTQRRLKRAGYSLSEATVDLSRLGVPQKRSRHILLATRRPTAPLTELLEGYTERTRSVRWAIGDLEDMASDDLLDSTTNLSSDNRQRIEYLFDSDSYDLPNTWRPPCHRDKDHSYNSVYGRIRYDKPSQTITTGFTSPGQGRYVHPTRRRVITPHEAARLQHFPDWFDFSSASGRGALARAIGNAVPMKLSWAVLHAVYTSRDWTGA